MADDREIDRKRLLIERLAELLSRHVVGIFREGRQGRPESHGSGFLVSSSSGTFLISAAHVLDPLQSGTKLFFYAGPGVIRTLAGSVRVTNPPPGKDRKADRYDVGVLRLLEPASPPDLPVNKTGLPLSALMPRALPRRGKEYLVTGFPASKSKLHPVRQEVDAGFYGNWCPSASEPAYPKLGLSLEDHIVMPFSRKKVVGKGLIIRAFPNPEGMSGSPVWLLRDEAGTNDPVQTPVVGVLIEYHRPQHLLVATDINTAVELMKAFDA